MKSVNTLLEKGVTHCTKMADGVPAAMKSNGPNEKPSGISKESMSGSSGGKFKSR